MPPIWLRLNYATMEAAIAIALLALGGLVLYESIALGPGWGEQGPEPGFFPFVLTLAMILGALVVLYPALVRGDRRAFFEAPRRSRICSRSDCRSCSAS
jgi:putative tricarboxylic transport membrane protein